ncbi:hypothetical protein LCGC14_2519320, partial [marine sediment metagenome]
MPIDVHLLARAHEQNAIKEPHYVPSQFHPHEIVAVQTSGPQRHGVFKAVTSTTQTTTIITAPAKLGAIVVTDLLITTNKAANGIITIRFSDSSTDINIGVFPVDLAVNQSIAFVGLFRGWQDAQLEMVTSGANFDATVTA